MYGLVTCECRDLFIFLFIGKQLPGTDTFTELYIHVTVHHNRFLFK